MTASPLLPGYYRVVARRHTEEGELFRLQLMDDCCVYQGHFPGQPVCPGVCNIHMLLECAALMADQPLRLSSIKLCRLTTLLTPGEYPELEAHIQLTTADNGGWLLNASLGKGEDVYLSLRAEVVAENE